MCQTMNKVEQARGEPDELIRGVPVEPLDVEQLEAERLQWRLETIRRCGPEGLIAAY